LIDQLSLEFSCGLWLWAAAMGQPEYNASIIQSALHFPFFRKTGLDPGRLAEQPKMSVEVGIDHREKRYAAGRVFLPGRASRSF
jgi:hypothetical protein